MTAAGVVDDDNPWPWLEAFTETARPFFNGRDDDIEELAQCVQRTPACVLFGKSGLGKTSLLQAGLAPGLARQQLFPVFLKRLDHAPGAPGISAQLLKAMLASAGERGLTVSSSMSGDTVAAFDVATVWEVLHKPSASAVHDAAETRLYPLFVLDQFEEIFTLVADAQRRRTVFAELADLIENRLPQPLAEKLHSSSEAVDDLDPDAQPYRFLISVREDYLADLEALVELSPRLGPNRYRLLPMTRDEALLAILGHPVKRRLVSDTSAEKIVDFIAQDKRSRSPGPSAARIVEPALLSLVCANLNEDRRALSPPPAQIDVGDLESRGALILERFYDSAFATVSEPQREQARRWAEANLITEAGTRRPYPITEFDGDLAPAVAELVTARLLRIESSAQGDQVEFVHDRLALVARARAQERDQLRLAAEAQRTLEAELREAKTAEAQRALEAKLRAAEAIQAQRALEAKLREAVLAQDRRRRRLWLIGTSLAALFLLLGVFASYLNLKNAELKQLRDDADASAANANALKLKADDAASAARQQSAIASAAAASAVAAGEETRAALIKAQEANERAAVGVRTFTALRASRRGADSAADMGDQSGARGMLMALAGYRLAQKLDQYSLEYTLGALQVVDNRYSELAWIRTPAGTRASAAAFLPDGRLIVGLADGTLQPWDTAAAKPAGRALASNSDAVVRFVFSARSDHFVAVGRDGTVRLWDASALTSPQLRALPLGRVGVAGLRVDADALIALSPDGAWLAIGGWQGVDIVDARSGELRHRVRSLTDQSDLRLVDLQFSGRGDQLVAADRARGLIVIDAGKGTLQTDHPMHGKAITNPRYIRFDRAGLRFSALGVKLQLWDWDSGIERGTVEQGGWPRAFGFSNDGLSIVADGGIDGLRAYRVEDLNVTRHVGFATVRSNSSFALNPDFTNATSIGQDGSIRLWSNAIGPALRFNGLDNDPARAANYAKLIVALAVSADSKLAHSVDQAGKLQRWKLPSAQPLGDPVDLSGGFSPNGRVAINGDGTVVALVKGAAIRVWRAGTGRTEESAVPFALPDEAPNSVSLSRDGKHLAIGSSHGSIVYWNLVQNTRRTLFQATSESSRAQQSIRSITISNTGGRIVAQTYRQTRWWNVATGLPVGLPILDAEYGEGAVFTNDDRRAFTASRSGLEFRDGATGRMLQQVTAQFPGRQLTITADDKYLIGFASGLNLWSAESGGNITDARSRYYAVRNSSSGATAASPDGRMVVNASVDGIVVYPMLEAWADRLCAKLAGNLTEAAWARWVSPDAGYVEQCPGKARLID